MRKLYGDLNLVNGSVLNLRVEQKHDSDVVFDANDIARIYFSLDSNELMLNDGTKYIPISFPSNFSNLLTTLGNTWVSSKLTFNYKAFSNFNNVSNLTADSSLFDVLKQLDSSIKNQSNLKMSDLTDFTPNEKVAEGYIVYFNGNNYTTSDLDTLIKNFADLYLGDLGDVDLTNQSNGSILVYSKTSKTYESKIFQFSYENVDSNTQFLIDHNLGIQYCSVTVIDRTNSQKINDATITYLNENQLVVNLNTSKPINAYIVGLKI